MMNSNLVLASTVLLVLGAGVVVGRLSDHLPMRTPNAATQEQRPRSWLVDQLKLTTDQRQKMDAIWAATRQEFDKDFEERRAQQKDRDQAILNLLSPQQRVAYDKINNDYHAASDDLFKDRQKALQDANDQTRALLSSEQQKIYDLMSKEMQRNGPRGPGGPGRGPGSGMGPGMGPGGFPGEHPRGGDHLHGDHAPGGPATTRPTGGGDAYRAGADVSRA
jgi:hypothetical protein